MHSPNRTMAMLAACLFLVAGLVPASAAAFCGPAAECGPCGQLPVDARIVAACCCCGDLAAAESAAPDVAEGAGEVRLGTLSLHADASPALTVAAEASFSAARRARASLPSPARVPLYQFNQSLLI